MKTAVLLLIITSCAFCQYVSPGFEVAWGFNKSVSIIPKVSLGTFLPYGKSVGFVNITFGIRANILQKNDNQNKDVYSFLELESGVFPAFDKSGVSCGAGFGFGFVGDGRLGGRTRIYPKISAFAGGIAFARMDMLFLPKTPLIDLGVMGVLPIPLFSIEMG